MLRSPQGGLSGHGQTEGCYVPPVGEATPQVDVLGPQSRRWGGVPLGRPRPTVRAVALLRVDPTRGSEAGTVQGLCCHTLSRERKGVWGGQDRPGGEREGTRGGEAAGRRRLRKERARGRGSGKWRERQLHTATKPGVMPNPPAPPPPNCFVVAEDLNDFMLNFSVLLCISLSPFVSQYLHYFIEFIGQLS